MMGRASTEHHGKIEFETTGNEWGGQYALDLFQIKLLYWLVGPQPLHEMRNAVVLGQCK